MAETVTLFGGDPRQGERLRELEAVLFAAAMPLSEAALTERLPEETNLDERLRQLQTIYANRGVNLVEVADGWAFRTAPDLAHLMTAERVSERRLSRAAMETLAIIAYHQPVTRAEIEEVRGVAVAKGTLDILLETGWVRLRGRRRVPGRPVTFGTTGAFLEAFTLATISDLPGLDDLRGAGLLEGTPPAGFSIPLPRDDDALDPDEDPLDADDGEPR
ncbi:SMC-Scp complex subunit ScpB [Acuticoccus mangrovi]|uniref:SMC-Scp complex subunit ScpB n=1 Tax=Acuticoccus mangrovi TaxID=2796142 RepID=A0A934MGF4_9HYPH|nr:SMC-Scp complex subunit ScpB [Acuticoccus mangrovi]MBJ3776518.1 SMC-Scp complex subunit ScpB [Acuticoccus mangrovi]